MNVSNLLRFGIPGEVISRWAKKGTHHLLPIQAESVLNYGLLEGKSVIINGPGTSGKTFCGEMAAISQAASRKKAIFIVPHKAIAIEKYNHFHDLYSSLGLKVVISSRDHTEFDSDIRNNNFDILVTIYEKLNSLTSDSLSLIQNCGCFILDEFQMISDSSRGGAVELLVSKIRGQSSKKQIVILMGGGISAQSFSDWLSFPLLEDARRPVELRLGTLHNGTFQYRGFNNHAEGEEQWIVKPDERFDEFENNSTVEAIKYLVEKGEQVLIFVPTKKKSANIACYLSGVLNLEPAKELINALNDIPPSKLNDDLGKCLENGIAFHHSDLGTDQRRIIENGFGEGQFIVLVSTTTLAWGVNLPAKNVFIEGMKYCGSGVASGRDILIPLSTIDFHQAAGRAGRFNQREKFGRAILTASSSLENEILWQTYIQSGDCEISSGLKLEQLPELILRLISCGVASNTEMIKKSLDDLFAVNRDDFNIESDQIIQTVNDLQSSGFIIENFNHTLKSSELGLIASSSGFYIDSILMIKNQIETSIFDEPLEWLLFSMNLREWLDAGSSYFINNSISSVTNELNSESNSFVITESDYVLNFIKNADKNQFRRIAAPYLCAIDWISDVPTIELEKKYNRASGGFRKDFQTLVWIIGVMEKMLGLYKDKIEFIGETIADLSQLRKQLYYGVSEEKMFIATMLKIDREYVVRLYKIGISSIENLERLDYSTLVTVMPEKVANQVYKKIELHNKKSKTEAKPYIENHNESIVFTGVHKKALKEVIISGKSVFLQATLYQYLQKLWWDRLSGNGWVYKENLGPGDNQAKYISKIRNILRKSDVDFKIVSDGNGSYKILLPEHIKDAVNVGK